MTEKIYLETLRSVLGRSIFHYSRVATFMNFSKKRIIMKSCIKSHFGYCLVIWMFHSRGLNNKINRIHERALRITYNDKSSSYRELLALAIDI